MQYNLFTDGACTRNPGGVSTYGFLLEGDDKEIDFGYGVICSGAKSNNVMAECYAISQGLMSFLRHWDQRGELTVLNDSQYVIGMLTNNEKLKDFHFRLAKMQIREISKYLKITLKWIPRKNNKADILSKRFKS